MTASTVSPQRPTQKPTVAVGVGVLVLVYVGVLVRVSVGVELAVRVGVGVTVAVAVAVGVWVCVEVARGVGVRVVLAAGLRVTVLVGVALRLAVAVGVRVTVAVTVGVSVRVDVGIGVGACVLVGVALRVVVGRGVPVRTGVAVGFGVGALTGVRVGVLLGVGTKTAVTKTPLKPSNGQPSMKNGGFNSAPGTTMVRATEESRRLPDKRTGAVPGIDQLRRDPVVEAYRDTTGRVNRSRTSTAVPSVRSSTWSTFPPHNPLKDPLKTQKEPEASCVSSSGQPTVGNWPCASMPMHRAAATTAACKTIPRDVVFSASRLRECKG